MFLSMHFTPSSFGSSQNSYTECIQNQAISSYIHEKGKATGSEKQRGSDNWQRAFLCLKFFMSFLILATPNVVANTVYTYTLLSLLFDTLAMIHTTSSVNVRLYKMLEKVTSLRCIDT